MTKMFQARNAKQRVKVTLMKIITTFITLLLIIFNTQVKIPKFSMNNSLDLRGVLTSISINDVLYYFKANLSQFFLPVKNENLFISRFYHGAVITVMLQCLFGKIIFLFYLILYDVTI